MPRSRKPSPFGPNREDAARAGKGSKTTAKLPAGKGAAAKPAGSKQQVIPDAVAGRMARRIALATGIPTLMGMAVFVASYLLVSRQLLDIPPAATLVASGGCFLLGLLGLSYGVLSASWEDAQGSLLGFEQIPLNIGRLRASVKAMRQGSGGSGLQG
jgi:hypothetical protein